jgi:hypothetical protein
MDDSVFLSGIVGIGSRDDLDLITVNVFDRRRKRDDLRPNLHRTQLAGTIPFTTNANFVTGLQGRQATIGLVLHRLGALVGTDRG